MVGTRTRGEESENDVVTHVGPFHEQPMRCARHDHQFGVADTALHRDGVRESDLVVIADHDELPGFDPV